MLKKIPVLYRYFLLLLLLFFIAEIFVNPLLDFPLNDDWSYSKSVKFLLEKNQLTIGNWCAMTLVTQIYWGFLWTKIFGFTFTVLRFSTLFSSCLALFVLFLLVYRISGNSRLAFWAGLVLLFIPLYFNLSNTFMTDVNFVTLLLLYLLVAHSYLRTGKRWLFVPLLAISVAITLLRQYGLVLPLALLGSLIFSRWKDWQGISILVFSFLLLFLCLKGYESHLKSYLSPDSPYKFSSGIDLTDPGFYEVVKFRLSSRYGTIFLNLLFYSAPFCVLFLVPVLRQKTRGQIFFSLVLTVLLSAFFIPGFSLLNGNVVKNMAVGPETVYESWQSPLAHCHSESFTQVLQVLTYLFCGSSVFLFLLVLPQKISKLWKDTFSLFCIFLMLGYLLLLLVTESYFDRYHLPLIVLFIIGIAILFRSFEIRTGPAMFYLLFFVYASVAGTRDYFQYNDKRWQAYVDLQKKGVPLKDINAGFEINCWAEGEDQWWSAFLSLESYDYLIQFQGAPGFQRLRDYPFRRYYPFRQDTLFVYLRILPDSLVKKVRP